MSFIENQDILTLTIIVLIIICMITPLLFWCLKRYDIVITLMLLTPFVPWIFSKNIPKEIGETQEGPSSYIRVSIILILGIIGYLNFFKLKVNSREKVPSYFKLFAVFRAIIFHFHFLNKKFPSYNINVLMYAWKFYEFFDCFI